MNTFKINATRQSKAADLNDLQQKRWTRHGSTQYLLNEAEVEATIHYVVNEQGEPMSVFENRNRWIYDQEPRA